MHKDDKEKQNLNPLLGVKCSAEHCIFHDNSIECKATEICIDPSSALTSKQTACTTFKPRNRDFD